MVSPDGVVPSRIVGVSASVNLPLHHNVQKFSSGTGSPGWSRKKGHKTGVCVCVCVFDVLNGENLQLWLQSFLPMLQICILGSVFARMSPDQKSRLVEDLQDLGLVFHHMLVYMLLRICFQILA